MYEIAWKYGVNRLIYFQSTSQGPCKRYKWRRIKNLIPEFTDVNEDVKFLIQQ